ncbi:MULTISPECIES: MFS transporter [Bacillaceae]
MVGGLIADRFNKRTILFLSDSSRAILIAVLLGFVWFDAAGVVHLIVLAALFGISDAFSYPALNSLTPILLHDDQLQRGNSFIQMTSQVSPILGPALGGSMIAILGFSGVFSLALVMLLLSSIAVLFIRVPDREVAAKKVSPWQDLKEGFHYARKNELIISIVFLALFLNLFFTGPYSMGMPIMVKDVFAGDAAGLALVEASMGVGSLLGAVALAAITIRKTGAVMLTGLVLLGVLYMLTGFFVHLVVTAVFVALLGFFMQVVNIPILTILQQTTDKKMLGRMMSFLMTVSTGLVPVSYVLTSFLLAAGARIQMIIIVGGVVVTLLALGSLRNKRILGYQQ